MLEQWFRTSDGLEACLSNDFERFVASRHARAVISILKPVDFWTFQIKLPNCLLIPSRIGMDPKRCPMLSKFLPMLLKGLPNVAEMLPKGTKTHIMLQRISNMRIPSILGRFCRFSEIGNYEGLGEVSRGSSKKSAVFFHTTGVYAWSCWPSKLNIKTKSRQMSLAAKLKSQNS